MIDAKDLRIGNEFEYFTPEGWERNIIDVEDIAMCIKDNTYFNTVYRPLPLTEDILLKCEKYIKWDAYGNENYGGYIDFIGDWKLMLRYWDGEFIFYVVTVNKKKGYYKSIKQIKLKIKYLHTLQNLVHSLTQKELTVQL
jgi:hypothetical protein